MSDLDRRPSPTVSSPRIERLSELYARLDDPAARERRTDADLDAICDEVYAITDNIMVAPAPGLVGVTEHAMAVHYWFRPKGSCSGPGGDVECVQALVAAVFALATSAGGAHA